MHVSDVLKSPSITLFNFMVYEVFVGDIYSRHDKFQNTCDLTWCVIKCEDIHLSWVLFV